MNKHSIANKHVPIALALVAFTAVGTAPVFAQQSGWGAGILSRNGTPFVHNGPFDRAPALPPPVFNPSSPYTVPQTPEVPVSPASPGSIFGNH